MERGELMGEMSECQEREPFVLEVPRDLYLSTIKGSPCPSVEVGPAVGFGTPVETDFG
jgi:hypothetical protein